MTSTRQPLIRLYEDEVCLDAFAGGGGTSTGIEMVLGRSPDFAINHDAEALAMHEANHPQTRHIKSNIRKVDYRTLAPGKRFAFGWFSPDCTFHSKARGGKPFRDRNRARRIRGLAWEVVRCAVELGDQKPRILFLENVEEWKEWGPLGADGRPDPSKKGLSFRQWMGRLRAAGYHQIECRELRASRFGAPTSRKRLFVVARCDGQPIVWPEETHGPTKAPYRTAAECIDFGLAVPSIFMNKREAKTWGRLHGCRAPRRPLARATLRRIARGIQRFVIDSAEPFIIKYHGDHGARGEARGQLLTEPLRTLDTANRFALITPLLASVRHHDESHVHSVNEPIRTIPASDREFALIAPTLIQTSYGERKGQAPRTLDLQSPLGTIVAGGIKHSLVAAFLAKHNGGHEATGQRIDKPTDTIVCRENKALVACHLQRDFGNSVGSSVDAPVPTITAGGGGHASMVTSHLLKLKGTCKDGHPLTVPMPTVQAGGTHLAEVRAFLVKYFGTKKDGRPLDAPLDTITTKERYGLVTVTIAGEQYAMVDIGMRMLTPRELFRAQGFPLTYQIERVEMDTPLGVRLSVRLSKKAQTRLVGNSVPPDLAAAVIRANVIHATDTEAVA